MKWSWPIARAAGIRIYLHATFLLLILWAGTSQYLYRHYWADAALAIGFVLVLFVIIVLHELGHALTARRFGIQTRDITLLPIGGVARLERMPEEPRQELLVALAGPAVNVCLAVFFFALLGGNQQLARITDAQLFWSAGLLSTLMWVNIVLAVFNLIPAFPMDGGRVLRALLATRFSYVRATNAAAVIGQSIAILFAFVGISSFFSKPVGPFSNPFLLLIAVFVWIGASQESGLVQLKSALGGLRVQEVMIRNFRTIAPEEPLSNAAAHLLAGWQQDFPVVADGRLVGLLTRPALVAGLSVLGPSARVDKVMHQEFGRIAPEESAESALMRLRTEQNRNLLVTRDHDDLVGMLRHENFGEFLTIQAALHSEPEASKWVPVTHREAA